MKKEKIYSRLDDIKMYQVDLKPVHGTLVLEGGAFRGIYSSGVLDCLLDNGILIDTAVGISAGGMNGANYLCGARGRCAHSLLKYRFDSRYVGRKALYSSKGIVGFKFILEDYDKEYYLEKERLFNDDLNLHVGCCNLETGECEYFNPKDKDTFLKAVQASASMPLVSSIVRIDGGKYLDGGCSVKLPIRYTIDKGYEKIIFVGTRPLDYRRKLTSPELKLEKIRYKNYPNFIKGLKNANKRYNLDAEFLQELAKKKAILTICPSERISVSRLEKDLEKLGDLYFLGYEDCKKRLPEIKKYLGIKR